MKYTYIYVILGICAVAVSIGKALAVNFGISKYLSKKSYNGKFKVIKTASISFGVGYILLALASLFIVTMVMDAIYSHIRFDEYCRTSYLYFTWLLSEQIMNFWIVHTVLV